MASRIQRAAGTSRLTDTGPHDARPGERPAHSGRPGISTTVIDIAPAAWQGAGCQT